MIFKSGWQRLAYTLIAGALSTLLLVFSTPEISWAPLIFLSYLLLALGIVLLLVRKVTQIIQQERISNSAVECQNCGWNGRGHQILRAGGCPECDSVRVVAR